MHRLPSIKALKFGFILIGLIIYVSLPLNTIILPALAASDYVTIVLYLLAEQSHLFILRKLPKKSSLIITCVTTAPFLLIHALLSSTHAGKHMLQALYSAAMLDLSHKISCTNETLSSNPYTNTFPVIVETVIFGLVVALSYTLAGHDGGTPIHAIFGFEPRDHLGTYASFLLVRLFVGCAQSIILGHFRDGEVRIHIQSASSSFEFVDGSSGFGGKSAMWCMVNLNICLLGLGIAATLAIWVLWLVGVVSILVGLAFRTQVME